MGLRSGFKRHECVQDGTVSDTMMGADAAELSSGEAAQLVDSVAQTSYSDVGSAQEALASVDGGGSTCCTYGTCRTSEPMRSSSTPWATPPSGPSTKRVPRSEPQSLRIPTSTSARPFAAIEGASTSVTLDSYGLATAHTDVKLDLFITHDDLSKVRVTLRNPTGTEYVVHDRSDVYEIYLDGDVVRAFPGDEDANGTWTLTVQSFDANLRGTIHEFGLEVTSRWD